MSNIFNDAYMTYIKKPYIKGNSTSLKVFNSYIKSKMKGNFCTRTKNTYAEIDGYICDISSLDVKALYEQGSMKK